MTFELTTYQQAAADSCIKRIRYAQSDFVNREGKKTAVGLTAPTGAGKTVIATSVLEQLLFGDASMPPNQDLAVLWVTDDPALNRQTRDKMLLAGAHFTDSDFIEIDSSFDQKRLERGKTHFAHVQLLGKGTTSMQPSNSREYGLWEIIAATVRDYGENFLLVIDEAHKGTEGARHGTATILERLCHGGAAEHFTGQKHPAAPVVFGITATPERFRAAMDRAGRTLEDVIVPVADVRESGLLKDRIIVRHPGENQPSEATLLAQAVSAMKKVDSAWQKHAEETGTVPVDPLLVVQVPPAISDGEVGSILSSLESEWPALRGDAVVHAFDTHATIRLPGDREVRYVAPDRIADNKTARVVLFKNALTTGWDCPRAEVMLSLRAAKDYTNIAQLIGRMVRTPLAERVETDESLNWVTLYLPHYSKEQVARVVEALGDDTGGDVEITVEPVDCVPTLDKDHDVWGRLTALPSAQRTKRQWRSETDRLVGLAALLRGHNLVAGASGKARARIVGAIKTEVEIHKETLAGLVTDVETLDVSETVWDTRRGEYIKTDGQPVKVSAKLTDIEKQFAAAARLLPDASAKWYWNALYEDDTEIEDYEAKARVAALVKTTEMAGVFRAAIEKAAADQVAAWRGAYANQVAMLGRKARASFEEVWNPQSGTMTVDIEIPASISAPTEKIKRAGDKVTTELVPTYEKHLYGAPAGHPKAAEGRFPANLTSWEVDVLTKETSYQTLVRWYRNPPRSKHGLGIPYRSGEGEWALLYPDFLFFHENEDGTFVDVVDPHRHNEADTGPKWAGLAGWAAENADTVRRAVAVIKVGSDLKSLDLTQDGIAQRLESCAGKTDVESLFDELGGTY